jgi:hypothetical protein
MPNLSLTKIKIDGGTQPREAINEATVAEYAEAMAEGVVFPDIIVFNDGANHWLADGFTRFHAARKIGYKEINADIRTGTLRDAILFSVGANADHGQRRTNADKRKAVTTLLQLLNKEGKKWTDVEVSKQCRVSSDFVGNVRRQANAEGIINPINDACRTVTRNGKTYEQNTANIGRKPSPLPETDEEFQQPVRRTQEPEENKPVQRVAETYSDGITYCMMAISQMERIHRKDTQRKAAWEKMRAWLDEHE